MFNLPPNIFNNMHGRGLGSPTDTFTASGRPYTGPFANDTRTPFRTVEGIGQYGNGLNASAAQLYDYYGGAPQGMKPVDVGAIQSIDDFIQRGALSNLASPIKGNYPNGGVPWGDDSIKTNSDWLNWMRQQNALSGKDLDWFGRWFQESGNAGNNNWVSGNVRGWDHGRSGLNQENKNRVSAAINYMNNYWDPFEEKGRGMPADPLPPKRLTAGGGIFNGVDMDILNTAMGGMR